ncbi:tRNA lysidine(34) synthetase TilS [Frigidibacter sp. RF13]|uniref:tRNA lysidine(34) synthetase TilS n=1 Tax=Frigidibacter sp. RF13 TaxID=2997340 RepID=UPI00226EA921|nr:tRNA lysidine(34) synthetase TilS [Frigidibacter sp. RF13]MCY1126988.1 tRNA lysidine(34) synthetase TilS [Frigidibacter sp. RF13]
MPVTDQAELATLVRTFFTPSPPARLGVAVSGGGDSVALLHLLNDWRLEGGPDLAVVTVDHGLRPEAAAEAAGVAAAAKVLGLPHRILKWECGEESGNLPDRARRARYGLIADWAKAVGIGTVALGHTADDQAETLLMRLARGSGVDGLSGMAAARDHRGVRWARPLLEARRAALRAFLLSRRVSWIEDPTNEDATYDRVKARAALAALAPLGVTVEGLVETAGRMAMARAALAAAAVALARRAARVEAGDVILEREALAGAAEEVRYRLFAQALMLISGADYRPRFEALKAACATALDGTRATLSGCIILPRKGGLHITREPAAVADVTAHPGEVWDGRWRLIGPSEPGQELRALGEAGLAECPGWRATGLPRPSLLASPAVWQGDHLIAAPLAGRAEGWAAECLYDRTSLVHGLIVH